MCTDMDTFWGKVIGGAKRGKAFGFPTANMALHKKIPEGIYVSKVHVDEKQHNALTFIGSTIMFGEKKVKAESYLLDFSGDLYGKFLTVTLLKKIRKNQTFNSLEELVKQMHEDVVVARKFFSE